MGNPISTLREEAEKQEQEKKDQMEERLHILEKMVTGKLNAAKQAIIAGERNDEEIHGGTVVALHQQINITKKEGESQSLKSGLNDFFQGDLIGGLEQIVQVGADTVLQNASIGEYETTDMFIVWSHNALLRCDAYYYRWNFSTKGIIQDVGGAVGVYLVKRVIDLTKTDPQVLTYAISQMADRLTKGAADNGEAEALKMIDEAITVLQKVVSLQQKFRMLEVGKGPEK